MTTAKHTPGPWRLNGLPNPTAPDYYCVYIKPGGAETVQHICQVSSRDGDTWKANARLIAAAPQLLKALQDMYSAAPEPNSTQDADRLVKAAAAIEAATEMEDAMKIGTAYFVSRATANRYYGMYGFTVEDVGRKIEAGEIHLGVPPLKDNQTLTVIDQGTRYAIED